MIEIMNLRHEKPSQPFDFYVDRRVAVGNPFYMESEKVRNIVCDDYIEWFEAATKELGSDSIIHNLNEMIQTYKIHNRLRLFCWCTPKRCHAETIKKYIEQSMEEPDGNPT